MRHMTEYAHKYDIEMKIMKSFEKRSINFSKNSKNITIDYEELIKKYLNDEIGYEAISEIYFTSALSTVDDTLLIEILLKHYEPETFSMDELNKSIISVNESLEILYRNLNLLNEYGNDVIENEDNIRKINTDTDNSLKDETKKYIKRYYVYKVKSIKSTINHYTDILNILKQIRENVLNNEFKNIDNLNIKKVRGNSYVPFTDFYYNRIRKFLKLEKRVKNLNIKKDRITNINEGILKRLLCENCSLKFNDELAELEKINEKRRNLDSDENEITKEIDIKEKKLNMI